MMPGPGNHMPMPPGGAPGSMPMPPGGEGEGAAPSPEEAKEVLVRLLTHIRRVAQQQGLSFDALLAESEAGGGKPANGQMPPPPPMP